MLRKRLLNSQSSEPYIGVYKVVDTINVPYTGDSKVITVLSTGPFTIFANEHSDEITLSPSTIETAGENQVRVTSSPSTSTSNTYDTITIRPSGTNGSKDFDIDWTRAGAPLTYSVTPSSISAPYAGGTYNINFITNDSTYTWNATTSQNWVTLSVSSGTGAASLNATIEQNDTANSRTATVSFYHGNVVLGTVQITQEGNTSIRYSVTASVYPQDVLQPKGQITGGTGLFTPGASTTITKENNSGMGKYAFWGWFNAADKDNPTPANILSSEDSYTISDINTNYDIVALYVPITNIIIDVIKNQSTSSYGNINITTLHDGSQTTISGGFRLTFNNIDGKDPYFLGYATPNTGRGFDKWYTKEYGTLSTEQSYYHGAEGKHASSVTVSNGVYTASYTIEVYFSATGIQYTITTNAGANGTVRASSLHDYAASDSVQVYQNTFTEISARANDGYRFAQWSDGSEIQTRNIYAVANETYTATFTTATYSLSAPTSVAYNTQTQIYGVYNGNQESSFTSISMTSTIYGSITSAGVLTNRNTSGSPITVTITATNHGMTASIDVILLSNNAVTYTVSTNVSPAGVGIVNGGGTYARGANVTLTTTPTNDNYVFSNWTGSISGSTNPYTINNLSSNQTVTAVFTIPSYNITVQSDSGNHCLVGINGSTPSYYQSVTINKGDTFILSATPDSGYNFQYFLGSDGNTYNTDAFYTVSSNLTLTAVVTQGNTYTITINTDNSDANNRVRFMNNGSGGNTSWAPSASVVVEEGNANVRITATSANGYTFSGWYNGNTLVSTSQSYKLPAINSNITLTARYSMITYTLNVVLASGQSIPNAAYTLSGSGNNYNINSTATISAVVNSGYTDDWEFDYFDYGGENNITTSPYNLSISDIKDAQGGKDSNTSFTVYAYFRQIQHIETVNVELTANYPSSCTLYFNGTQVSSGTTTTVEKNSAVTINISVTNPNTYDFVDWSDSEGAILSSNTTYSFAATSNISIYATLAAVTFTFTINNASAATIEPYADTLTVYKSGVLHRYVSGVEKDQISVSGANMTLNTNSNYITITDRGTYVTIYSERLASTSSTVTITGSTTYNGNTYTSTNSKTITIMAAKTVYIAIGNYDYPQGSQTDINEYGNIYVSSTVPEQDYSNVKAKTLLVSPSSSVILDITVLSPSYLVYWDVNGEQYSQNNYIELDNLGTTTDVTAMLKDPSAL